MKVLVIDDHALIREALRGLIGKLARDAVLLDASNCAQATRVLEQDPDLDLILLDLTLPDRNGFSMLAELREYHPATARIEGTARCEQGAGAGRCWLYPENHVV
jgi:DNA-binding NarL/FixJ family response regulator